MAEFLLPTKSKLTISPKQKMFSVKNRMIEISENFHGKDMDNKCSCGQLETILHIYNCETLDTEEKTPPSFQTNSPAVHKTYKSILQSHVQTLKTLKNIDWPPIGPDWPAVSSSIRQYPAVSGSIRQYPAFLAFLTLS